MSESYTVGPPDCAHVQSFPASPRAVVSGCTLRTFLFSPSLGNRLLILSSRVHGLCSVASSPNTSPFRTTYRHTTPLHYCHDQISSNALPIMMICLSNWAASATLSQMSLVCKIAAVGNSCRSGTSLVLSQTGDWIDPNCGEGTSAGGAERPPATSSSDRSVIDSQSIDLLLGAVLFVSYLT